MADKIIKLVLVGDESVGKTTLFKRYKTGEFEQRYVASSCVEYNHMKFHTSEGKVCFNVVNIPGKGGISGLSDEYYKGGDCAIVMFGKTSEESFENVKVWVSTLNTMVPGIPIIIVGNKVDIKDNRVSYKKISTMLKCLRHTYNIEKYYDYSCKSNYNLEKPFLALVRNLMGDDEISLLEVPATQ